MLLGNAVSKAVKLEQAGEVDLICKQDGIICGLQIFERVFTLLDAPALAHSEFQDFLSPYRKSPM